MAQEVTVFLSTSEVTDVAAGPGQVHWSSNGGAGSFTPGDSSYSMLTRADGLGSNNLTAIAVDASGAVWYGTDREGVRWIDASQNLHVINTFQGLPSNEITSLDASGSGVWVGTAAGASYFVGDTRVETELSGAGLLTGDVLAVLVVGADSTWFATEGGLSLRTAAGWESHLTGSEARALVLDRFGAVWVTSGAGVYRREGGAWTQITTGLPHPIVDALVLADNVLWAGTGDGTARYDEGSGAWVPESSGLEGIAVTSLAYRGTEGLWAGTQGDGVMWWNGSGWEPRRPSSPVSNYASDMDVGSGENLWCGTGSDGNVFPLPQGTTTRGLVGFRNGVWENYRKADSPLASDNTYRVASDRDGGVWVGTWGSGLLHLDPISGDWDTLSVASGDLFSDYVAAMVAAPGGEIWFSEYIYGLAAVGTDGSVTHFGQNENLPTIFYRSVAVDSMGRVWAGAYGLEGAGDLPTLTRLDTGGTLTDKDDDEVAVFSATSWGGSVPVHAVACSPDGDVWLGVPDGIAWTDGESWAPTGEACAGGVIGQVRSIAIDRQAGVWYAGSQGLGEWRGNTWTQHVADDGGIAVDDVMSLAYDRERHTLWIGTWGGGVSRWAFDLPDTDGVEAPGVYAYPNPFRPDQGHDLIHFDGFADQARIEIYTLEGAEVVVLPAGTSTWNGMAENGEPVASGLYLFAGKDGRGEVRVGRIAVIR
jgi:ligand-binding sensor domain-containing protein